MHTKSKTFDSILLILLIMCSINFFGLQIVKGSFVRYIQFGYLILAISVSVPHILSKDKGFVLPVQLIFFSVFISVFTVTITRGQNIFDSIIGSVPVLIWGVFFYLKHLNFSIDKIEKIIISYGILYLMLYSIQFTHPDKNYFIDLETIDFSRGILRIVFPGRGLFYLTIFIAITKLTTDRKNSWFWGMLSLIGIVVTIMQVTRQFIFGAFVIYLIHFLKKATIANKIAIVLLFSGVLYFIAQSDNPIVAGLRDTQEQTQDVGENYVRIQAAIYFLTDFSISNFTRVFGNGVPYGVTSPFFYSYSLYIRDYGFWLSDVGLVAIYAMFGVFAVLGYLIIWVKSFTLKTPEKYVYLKYYLWFLLITCLTSDTIYSPNDLIATVLVIYIYQSVYIKKQDFRKDKPLLTPAHTKVTRNILNK